MIILIAPNYIGRDNTLVTIPRLYMSIAHCTIPFSLIRLGGRQETPLIYLTPKRIKLTMENKFFISSLKEAAKNTIFQHCWMPVET